MVQLQGVGVFLGFVYCYLCTILMMSCGYFSRKRRVQVENGVAALFQTVTAMLHRFKWGVTLLLFMMQQDMTDFVCFTNK